MKRLVQTLALVVCVGLFSTAPLQAQTVSYYLPQESELHSALSSTPAPLTTLAQGLPLNQFQVSTGQSKVFGGVISLLLPGTGQAYAGDWLGTLIYGGLALGSLVYASSCYFCGSLGVGAFATVGVVSGIQALIQINETTVLRF